VNANPSPLAKELAARARDLASTLPEIRTSVPVVQRQYPYVDCDLKWRPEPNSFGLQRALVSFCLN
jgi:hypothetical protein